MAERKFTRGLSKPGSAAQVRETVSQAVRESTVLTKPHLVEPLDFETFVSKNRTILQNDPQREMLLFPLDDVSQSVVKRHIRTTVTSFPEAKESEEASLFVRECLRTYQADWKVVNYKYSSYSGSYLQLPKIPKPNDLQDQLYEVDTELELKDEVDFENGGVSGTVKEGFILKGPESGMDSFISIATKSFKRRFMCLRPQVDGTHILELYKDERKNESKGTICLDFCNNVVKHAKRGKYSLELQLSDGHKPIVLVVENESELDDWIVTLKEVISNSKNSSWGSRKSVLLYSGPNDSPTNSGISIGSSGYGTLRGLEHSKNPELVKYARETDFSVAQARKEGRQNLFSINPEMQRSLPTLNTEEDILGSLDQTSSEDPFSPEFGMHIFLRCDEVKFKLQVPLESEMSELCQVEPYITTLAIYDAKNGRKVTEEFRFDVNHSYIRNLLPKEGGRRKISSTSSSSSAAHQHNHHHQQNAVASSSALGPLSSHQSNLSAPSLSSSAPIALQTSNSSSPLSVVAASPPKTNGNLDYSLPHLKGLSDGWISFPKQAILNVPRPEPDLYLVVRIEKVLQGGIVQSCDPYLRANTYVGDARLCAKIQKQVRSFCQRLHHYRMPFAWCARPLFKRFSGELDTTAAFGRIYRHDPNKLSDEDLLKFLTDHRRPEKLKHLIVIPGSVKILLKLINKSLPNTLTPCLLPVDPFPIPPSHDPTLEVAQFPTDVAQDSHPYSHYSNLLYVFPKSLKYDGQKTFAKARNIACVIELRSSDAENAKPLIRVFGRPGESLMTSQATTAVTHHNSCPDFYEEVKVCLPCHLTEKHHLLFTFYHISCETPKGPKKREAAVETPIGYSWCPLLSKGRLPIEELSLPVAISLPANYLSHQPLGLGKGFSGPDVRWVDGGKELFKLQLRLISTVYTADQHLNNFFVHCQKVLENGPTLNLLSSRNSSSGSSGKLSIDSLANINAISSSNSNSTTAPETSSLIKENSVSDLKENAERIILAGFLQGHDLSGYVKALHAVEASTLICFLPTILNVLFRLLVTDTCEDVALNTVRVLVHIVHCVHDVRKTQLLHNYVRCIFAPGGVELSKFLSASTSVHEALTKALTTTLRPANTDFLVVNKFLQHSWFFFQILVKSMALHLLKTDRIKMQRHERFPADYQFRVQNLLQALVPHILQKYRDLPLETRKANVSLAHFLKKCLTFMDRGFVFRLIAFYMDKFGPGDPRVLQEYKFEFLEIVCSHEHFVALNLPLVRGSVTRGLTRNTKDFEQEYYLSEEFCHHHFLVGLFLQEVKAALTEVQDIRQVAIAVFRNLLAKHAFDDRFQGKSQQARLTSLYLPFISILLENIQRLQLHHPGSRSCNNGGTGNMSESSSPLDGDQASNLAGGQIPTGTLSNTTTPSHMTPSKSLQQASSHQRTVDFKRNVVLATSDAERLNLVAGGGGSLPGSIRYGTNKDPTYLSLIAGGQQTKTPQTVSARSSAAISASTNSVASRNSSEMDDDDKDCSESSSSTSPSHTHMRSQSLPFAKQAMVRFDVLSSGEVKDLLVCFLHIVKHMSEELLIGWWQRCSESDILNFFQILEICLHQFKYLGKKHIGGGKDSKSNTLGGRGDVPHQPKAMTLPARTAPPSFNQRCNSIYGGESNSNKIPVSSEADSLFRALLEANMATEVGLIALDVLGLYGVHFKRQLIANDGDNALMKKIYEIYFSFLQVGQSESLVRHLFAALRGTLNKFPIALFQGNAQLCGKLCFELLKCCDSKLSTVRNEACALLYLLMRSNFEFTGRQSLTRVHLQLIVSVSRLLGEVISLNTARFQESLSIICKYADSDKAMQHTMFPLEVKDLTKRIRTVLMATAQMREHGNDAEMLVDLQHSLANSYAATPALRETWLQSMALIHLKRLDYSEAAHCYLHIAALQAEYLRHRSVFLPGCKAFAGISSNIELDEGNLKEDSGVDDVQYTEDSLLERLRDCADFLSQAERYEMMALVYKLIIPIMERRRNFESLAGCYKILHAAYCRIVEVTISGRRFLGRYYRVAFFGEAYFDVDHGKEYIYKEPKVTSLVEISQRLEYLYSEKFGKDSVKLIMDSIQVNPNECDPKYAYIQVTHVIPHFDEEELAQRLTEFERQNGLKKFFFETPFTPESGKARGNIEEQWKRKTILTTSRSFPYVKKRILVTSAVVQELCPIEVAIDEMRSRVSELQDVVDSRPTDLKKLQLKLQGSICVQVNAGPLAYAKAFLQSSTSSGLQTGQIGQSGTNKGSTTPVTTPSRQPIPLNNNYSNNSSNAEQVSRLKEVYRRFVDVCQDALDLNGKLIASEQYEYQAALRTTFQEMAEALHPLILDKGWSEYRERMLSKRTSLEVFNFISGSPGSSNV